jgi:D-alanyl-D-alanine carboxypeptidase
MPRTAPSRLTVLALGGLLAAGCAPGSTPPAPAPAPDARVAAVEARVRARLEALHAAGSFPGATAGFVLPDGAAGAAAAGVADADAGTPLRPDDRMLAGSIGKTFAAALAVRLAAEGRLELDAPVARWLGSEPWFGRVPNARRITVRMLLNHTSGIEEHVQNAEFQAAIRADPDRVWRPEELVAYVLDRPALFPAGEGWSYADTNYILLGMVLERVAGAPFYAEADRRFVRPLGLAATGPSDRRVLPGLVTGHISPEFDPFGVGGRTLRDGRFVVNPQFEWTGGGYVSTARDLARWAKALYEGRAFPAAWVDTMLASVPARTGPGDRYGLGVQVKRTPVGVAYGHSGWFPGYLSEMMYFPAYGIAVAVQVNTDDGRSLGMPLHRLLAEVAATVAAELHPERRPALEASAAGWARPAAPPAPASAVVALAPPAQLDRALDAACLAAAGAAERALGVGVRREDGGFGDLFRGERRVGCRLSARTAGAFTDAAGAVGAALRDAGWAEDPSFAADGPGATISGYRRAGTVCVVRAWSEAPAVRAAADCHADATR